MSREKFMEISSQNIKRKGIDNLLRWLAETDFLIAPASTRFHDSCEGGLCKHSINVYCELKRLLAAYPEIECTDETAAIISLFHDVCKIGCYKIEMRNKKNELGQWIQVPFYTFEEDFAYGNHGAKSVFTIERFMRLKKEEAVAIQCHMGNDDGRYAVSKAYEQFPLAWLLHVADEAATFIKQEETSNGSK
ncbi:MAG: HD domain-containing protein [Christensenella sp.]